MFHPFEVLCLAWKGECNPVYNSTHLFGKSTRTFQKKKKSPVSFFFFYSILTFQFQRILFLLIPKTQFYSSIPVEVNNDHLATVQLLAFMWMPHKPSTRTNRTPQWHWSPQQDDSMDRTCSNMSDRVLIWEFGGLLNLLLLILPHPCCVMAQSPCWGYHCRQQGFTCRAQWSMGENTRSVHLKCIVGLGRLMS